MDTKQTAAPAQRKPLRLWPGVVVAVLLGLLLFVVPSVYPDATSFAVRWRIPRRRGHSPLVAVLQPGGVAGAARGDRGGGCRTGRDLARRARVHRQRDDGHDARHLRRPGPQHGAGRLGGRHPPPLRRIPARVDGGRHPARMRRVHADTDRRCRRRLQVRHQVAVGPVSRGAAPVSNPRGADSAPAGARSRAGSRDATRARGRTRPSGRPDAPASRRQQRRQRRQDSGLARLSRARPRRRRPRRADRDRLVPFPAGADLAQTDRAGLVVLRGQRRSVLHAGAARRGRDRRLLQGDDRRTGVEAPRRGQVLGIEWRCRSARDADAQPTAACTRSARPAS